MDKLGDRTRQDAANRDPNLLIGRNAVREALLAGRPINSLYVRKGDPGGSLRQLMAMAREAGIAIKEVDGRKLDHLCGFANHQGVAAGVAEKPYATVEDLLQVARDRQEAPFLILCDGIEDPYNLGAIIRTAECVGAHGVIIPKRRSVGLTFAVGKAAAGALEYMPVARVTNLAETMDQLKEQGLWLYAADMAGESWCNVDYRGPVGLVIGAEGKGLSRLIREKADFVVSLPMKGKISSLNASVAAGVLGYEIARQRSGIQAK